jgi:zinc protease
MVRSSTDCRRRTRLFGKVLLLAASFVVGMAGATVGRPRAATGAEPAGVKKVGTIEGITEYRLENGVQVLLFPDPSKPTVTVNMTVFVGSRLEGYGEAGMAHLLEHMLFKGTPKFPEVPKVLQNRGASFNGTTWLDRTNYFETLPASDENLEFAIELEADRLVNSFIKGEDLASEMTVVRNEFERGENSPDRVLRQRMMSAAFEWHNYGRSTIGNRADIERVPIDKLRDFYRKYYQPDNVMVVIAGSFDLDKAIGLVTKHFGAVPRPKRELDNTYTEEPAQDGERLVMLRRVGQVAIVGSLYHIPPAAHPDFEPVDVLDTILSSAPTGRLYKALVETKKAARVSGGAFALHDPGVVGFSAEVAVGQDPQAVLDELNQVVESVAQEGVTAEEVQRAKDKLLKDRELNTTESSQIAIELSEWAAMGDWRLFFLYRDRLEKVTPDDVKRVAGAYLRRQNRTVGMFLPTEKPERVSIPAKPDLAKLIGDYKGREAVATGEAFDVKPEAIEARTKRGVMPTGIKAALLPKKTRGESVNLQLTLRYGDEQNLRGAAKACEYLPRLLTRGTKKLNRQQLQDELDKYRIELVAGGQPGELTVSLKTKRENLPAALEILRQVLREPTLPESEFELLRQADLARLAQSGNDPQTLATRFVNRTVNPYPAEDPRYIPTIAEETERVKSLQTSDVRGIYEQYLGGAVGELAIVGDFEPAAIKSQLDALFQDWKSPLEFKRITRTGDVQYKPTVEVIKTPDKANAMYFGGLVLPLRDDHADIPALVIGNFILGGGGGLSSRLGDRVRQKEGLSYGVGTGMRTSSVDPRTSFYVYAIANPQNVEKLKAAIREEIDRIVKDGVTEQELEAAKKGYLQQLEVDRTDDGGLAAELADSLFAGRTLSFDAKQEAAIASLTVAQVNEALRKYVKPERLVLAIAGDFK